MTDINITATVIVAGGPALDFARTLTAEAYQLIEVTLSSGATDLEVALQPGSDVQLLAIRAEPHDAACSYRAAKTTDATKFTLDQPYLFIGGALAVFGTGQPKKLFFSNATAGAEAKDVKLSILIARDATP